MNRPTCIRKNVVLATAIVICAAWIDAACSSSCPSDGGGAAGWYEVAVFTSSVRGAGTDANIHLTLFGEDGSAGKRVRLNPLIKAAGSPGTAFAEEVLHRLGSTTSREPEKNLETQGERP